MARLLNFITIDLQLVRSYGVLENLRVNRVIKYGRYLIVVVWAYVFR